MCNTYSIYDTITILNIVSRGGRMHVNNSEAQFLFYLLSVLCLT